jgi:adenine-specific DNA-methyltransferase
MPPKSKKQKNVETLKHTESWRVDIPAAEYESVMEDEEKHPIRVAFERRDPDLDPQLVWRGKDVMDWSDLVVQAPPLYVQEQVKPQAIIDDLMRRSEKREKGVPGDQFDMFADFDGVTEPGKTTGFYQHEARWTNRMILGDSLQVMASLAEREGLRGKVQCIYIDPPYGIKFNSNFPWSTTSRDVKDGKADHITREPLQRPRRHRLLVYRHRLQRRKLLRPPRLFPRSQRPLQIIKNHPQSRKRQRCLGDAVQRCFSAIRQTKVGADRRKGDQSFGG